MQTQSTQVYTYRRAVLQSELRVRPEQCGGIAAHFLVRATVGWALRTQVCASTSVHSKHQLSTMYLDACSLLLRQQQYIESWCAMKRIRSKGSCEIAAPIRQRLALHWHGMALSDCTDPGRICDTQ